MPTKVLVTYASYLCAACREAVWFEPQTEYGGSLHVEGYAVGECANNRCQEFHKRFRVTVPTIDVESIG